MSFRYVLLCSAIYLVAAGCSQDVAEPAADEQPTVAPEPEINSARPVVVYATSGGAQLSNVLEAYRAETGARYEILGDDVVQSPDLLDRPQQLPKTDLFIASSLAELWSVAEDDGLRPTFSDVINSNIPAVLRDPESRWSALSARARIIVYKQDLVSPEEIGAVQAYSDLGADAWRDRLCVSSARVAGNRSLVAFLIRQHGLREAEAIVRRWRANFGSSVYNSDADLLKAFSSGSCAIGIVDNNVLQDYESGSAPSGVAAHWFANSDELLIDIRGAGVSRHAANPDAAAELLVWMTSKDANALFAIGEMEFPANGESPMATGLASRSEYLRETDSLSSLGFLQEDATKLIERARYP